MRGSPGVDGGPGRRVVTRRLGAAAYPSRKRPLRLQGAASAPITIGVTRQLHTDAQRRAYLALTEHWQPARALAEHAGIPVRGAGTALLALVARGPAERRDGGRAWEYRRAQVDVDA
jgi:hypothetical protein